ncbi:choice-of-anchor D domain-containing protein [Halomicroarcula sp. F13]|uniref:Choice-of-anchor D domain-containing protein n=1 Tax=Haloarcula rubra TaxID=2487747 RepID=A0AAW4PTA0_9EURY|nr:malectin domain-containing carbohydrate-binding protein [Halomicroarcula rubra]MBX0324349.1 choice-of-anchor D domain-containing protein [Halomicroarcula rubra]
MPDRQFRQRTLAVTLSVLTILSIVAGGTAGAFVTAPGATGSGQELLQTTDSDVVYRVNAGGPSVTASSGPDWTADESGSTYSSGGSPYTASSLSSGDITNPTSAPSEVFLTERYGDHSWSFDVTSGQSYEVRLYFAEIYHGVSTSSADTGDRVFDVSIEGSQVLNDYDIVAETGGATTATVETFEVTPSDGTVDISFTTEVDNAKISAIEIVEAQPEPGVIEASPSSVDFGDVVVGDTATESVTLTNKGDTGDQTISVDSVDITGANASAFSQDFSGSTTLAPGESTTVDVTFAPTTTGAKSASLEATHNASNTTSPLTVGLSGNGQSTATVGFGAKDTVTSQVSSPTSIEFGPDGRLYVSQRFGAIKIFNVTRTGEDSYDATLEEELTTVKNLPNHDDQGNYQSGVGSREVTGLTVTGTADQPVIYVTSSDPRVGGGGSGDETGLDTNSGVVSRLTQQSDGSWEHDMILRGLPRSEENHATNGVQYYTQNGNEYLLLAQGGHTNQGAPSNNFAYTPEYALSAAILQVNLTQINNQYSEKAAANTDAEYLYDLPTLNGTSTPFGGQDGANMAILVEGDGVSVFSPGYRNPYDVERTVDGQVYTVDNGPNGGWGGVPVGEGSDPVCTNEPNENGDESNGDNLHYVTEGFYGGHPNPTRANPDGAGLWEETTNDPQQIGSTAGAVYDGYDGSAECDYQPSAEGDGALWENGASTNGMDEYTASNFDGKMQGDLLTAAFDGNVYRIQLNSDGTDISTQPNAQFSPGNTPLDVDAVGDDGPFPGTVFVAEFGGEISAYEPNDYNTSDDGDGTTCTGDDDPTIDEDGDGYDNADELDAGSDPCSASSTPPDYDDDGTSNVNDPDDDNDGIDDVNDEFAVDPDNGLTTTLPVERTFVRASVNDSLEGVGFTGLMIPEDGSTDYQDLYIPEDTIFGGANPALTVEAVKTGDATNNDQQHAYQFGVNPPEEEFVVDTTVTGFTDDPDAYEAAGIFIGTGDQDNYRKLTVNGFGGGSSGEYGVQLFGETAGTNNGVANPNVSDEFTGPGTTTRLELVVDPTTDPIPGDSVDQVNVTAYYTIDDGPRTMVGSTAMPAEWLNTSDGNGLAVGVISTSYQGDEQFSVTWNDLNVTTTAEDTNSAPIADAGDDQTVEENTTVTLDATGSSDPDGDQLGYSWTQLAGPAVQFDVQDTATPSFTAPEVDSETTLTFEVNVSDGQASDSDLVNVTVEDAPTEEVVLAVNAGGSNYTTADGVQYVNSSKTDVVTSGNTFEVTNEITNTTDDPLYQTELYGGGSNAPPEPNISAPVADGTYEVTLQFAELFQSSEDARLFDVYVEGEQVLNDYDIYAEAGQFNATDKTYTVVVTDGELNVDFVAEVDNAKIGAVKVVRVGDVPPSATSADVTVTENGGVDASTYSSGSFSVTNTGEENLSSVQIDLSESAIPDAVFDPNGTAGDATAKGVVIDSESGDGVGVVTTDSGAVFSQPHNGVDDEEGYDVLTLEFTDFEPGETVTFSTDVDPTTIKGASTTGGAGAVSGLELSGSAVTVSSSSATVSNDLYTDGSAGGSQANVNSGASAAPTLGVEGVTLGATDFPAHEAATVSDQQQNLTLSGPAGATVNLLTIEASEPPTDGYDIDAYEADNAEVVSNQTVTLDSNGQATVPVTLDTTNLNYYQAAVQDGPTSNGAVSQTVALEYEEAAVSGNTSASVALTPNSGIESSTYNAGSYQVTNTGDTNITTLRVDLNDTVLPDMVFDPFNTAGDDVGKEFTLDSGDVTVENVEYTNFHNGQNNSAGYDSLVVTLSGFEPSETMAFSIDNDPTSISSTTLGSQAAGPVSGLELAGGTVSVGADSTGMYEATLVGDGSPGGSEATVLNDTDETKPTIGADNVSLSPIAMSDRHSAATVTDANQTVTIADAPANADVTLLRIEGELNLSNVPDPYEIEDYEANKAVDVQYYSATTDSNGAATVDVTLTNSTEEGGLNYFVAHVEEPNGDTGPTSDYVVLQLSEEQANTAPTIDSITDKGVSEGESLTIDVPASDADGDTLDLSVTGAPFATADDANGTVTIAPGADTVGTYDLTVTADDGNATASESFAVYVDEPDQDGTVVFAVNAGGGSYTATDGTTYQADTNFTSGSTYSVSSAIGDTDDDTLYQTERYGDPFSYTVGVENGTYEVTLQFAEIYQGVSPNDSPDSTGPTDGTNENDRLFNATVEGDQKLTAYDIYSEVGPLNATSKTYTVEVTDGELTVEFDAIYDNAKLSAMTVEAVDEGPGPIGDFENAPTDPDGDGKYEDVNGDGDVNVGDAQALFANTDDPEVQENPDAFDFNDDGSVNVGDAQALFANGLEA